MTEYLRDPAWQFVGAVLAALAIGATLAVYWLQKQRKRLSYHLVSRNRLLTVTEEHQNNIQVTYDGEPVRDLCILVIRIVNSGNVPIAAQDFASPVTIGTGDASRVFSAAVTESEPPELHGSVENRGMQVLLAPTLLNPGDSVTVKLLVSDYNGSTSVTGRVVGVKTITNLGTPSAFVNVTSVLGLLLTIAGGYMFFAFRPDVAEPPLSLYSKIGIALFFVGYVITGFSLARRGRFSRVFALLLPRANS